MKTVWIYVDTNHHVGHPDHLKVSATPEVADEWFKENDPEGVAFRPGRGTAFYVPQANCACLMPEGRKRIA